MSASVAHAHRKRAIQSAESMKSDALTEPERAELLEQIAQLEDHVETLRAHIAGLRATLDGTEQKPSHVRGLRAGDSSGPPP